MRAFGVDVAPASSVHELRPAAVKTALILLRRDFAHKARRELARLADTEAHLVVVWIAAGDRAGAGLGGIAPVLHVVLLGHAGRAEGVGMVTAGLVFQALGGVFVNQIPVPDLCLA